MSSVVITYNSETGHFFANGTHTQKETYTTNNEILYDITDFLLKEGIISSAFSRMEDSETGFPEDFKLRDGDFVAFIEPSEKKICVAANTGSIYHTLYTISYKIGIICNNTVVYQDGGYDRIEDIVTDNNFTHIAAVFRCDDGASFDYAKKRFLGKGLIGKVYYRDSCIKNMIRENSEDIFS